jgi:hypothetical protein
LRRRYALPLAHTTHAAHALFSCQSRHTHPHLMLCRTTRCVFSSKRRIGVNAPGHCSAVDTCVVLMLCTHTRAASAAAQSPHTASCVGVPASSTCLCRSTASWICPQIQTVKFHTDYNAFIIPEPRSGNRIVNCVLPGAAPSLLRVSPAQVEPVAYSAATQHTQRTRPSLPRQQQQMMRRMGSSRLLLGATVMAW